MAKFLHQVCQLAALAVDVFFLTWLMLDERLSKRSRHPRQWPLKKLDAMFPVQPTEVANPPSPAILQFPVAAIAPTQPPPAEIALASATEDAAVLAKTPEPEKLTETASKAAPAPALAIRRAPIKVRTQTELTREAVNLFDRFVHLLPDDLRGAKVLRRRFFLEGSDGQRLITTLGEIIATGALDSYAAADMTFLWHERGAQNGSQKLAEVPENKRAPSLLNALLCQAREKTEALAPKPAIFPRHLTTNPVHRFSGRRTGKTAREKAKQLARK